MFYAYVFEKGEYLLVGMCANLEAFDSFLNDFDYITIGGW